MFTIKTPRLILRDLLESDLQPFFALASDPAVTNFQTFIRVENEAQACAWLKEAAFLHQQRPRAVYSLAILRKEDQAWLGWIGMGPPTDKTLGDLDFGYALATQFWGHGYMSEALRGLLDFSFRELPVNTIFGECEQENPGSARVMEKAGLALEAAFTEFDDLSARTKNMRRYAIHKRNS